MHAAVAGLHPLGRAGRLRYISRPCSMKRGPSNLPAPHAIADRILAGELDALDAASLTRYLAGEHDTWELIAAADRVRRGRFGNHVHLCSIVNAKQGGCPEDCGFCAQSKHFDTGVSAEKFLTHDQMVSASVRAQAQGASALGLVTATRGYEDGSRALRAHGRGHPRRA